MKRYASIALLLAVSGTSCSPLATSSPDPNQARTAPSATNGSRSVDDFRFIGRSTTMAEVIKTFGPPDRDAGSGIHIYVYRLADGSEIWIGSADASEIIYVRHGSEALFSRAQPDRQAP